MASSTSSKGDWNALAKRVAERKAGTPSSASKRPSDGSSTPPLPALGTPAAALSKEDSSPQLQFRAFQPRSRPTSTVVPSPPNLGVPLALPALAPADSARSATATLHVPYMGRDGERGSASGVGASGKGAGKPKSGPRLGGLGFMEDKGEALPPLQISLPPTTAAPRASAQAPQVSNNLDGASKSTSSLHREASRPAATTAIPIAPGRNPPRPVGTGTSPSGRHRQAHPDGGRPTRRPSGRRHSKTKASLGGRAPPIDRDVEREVQEVLSNVPVDDPELVRAMLADILIRAQRGELNGASAASLTAPAQAGADPSPGSSTSGHEEKPSNPELAPAPAPAPAPHPYAAAAQHPPPAVKRSGSNRSATASTSNGASIRATSPTLSYAKARRRSGSITSATGSGRRGSWVPPPATPPPTTPLPMTPDEMEAAQAAREQQAAEAIPEEPLSEAVASSSSLASKVKPREGALPLYRQNLDLANFGVSAATATKGLGVTLPDNMPSMRAEAPMPRVAETEEPGADVAGSSSFGDYSMRNPGLPNLDDLDDPESEGHFWSQMEKLGLASRLRSSVGDPSPTAPDDEIVFGDEETRRAAQAERDREDADLLARISLLRADHNRAGSDDNVSLFSVADSFATAQGSDEERQVGNDGLVDSDGSVYDGEDDGPSGEISNAAPSSPSQLQASTSTSPYVDQRDLDNSYRSGSSSEATASTDVLGPTTPHDSSPNMSHLPNESSNNGNNRDACLPPLAVGAAAGFAAGAAESGARNHDGFHPQPRETLIASEKARIDRDEVDYMELADAGALVAVPRRSRTPQEVPRVAPEPLAPPFPPPMRSRTPVADPIQLAAMDAAVESGSINSGVTGASKRMSVNVADLKAALANPAAAATAYNADSPTTSPSLTGPSSARVQRSFLPPPVQNDSASMKTDSRSHSPKPEPIVEEIEDVSDEEPEQAPKEEAVVAPKTESPAASPVQAAPAPVPASSYQEPPTGAWGFGAGIGGLATGISKLGSAAWAWGMSSVDTGEEQESADESSEGRRRQRSVPGQFDDHRLSTASTSSNRASMALTSTDDTTPEDDALLEEWKDVIPVGVDPKQFIAEVRAAMKDAEAEAQNGEAAEIDLAQAPAVAAAVDEAAPGNEEVAVVGDSGIGRAQLANAARGSPPLESPGGSPFGTFSTEDSPVLSKEPSSRLAPKESKRRSKHERRSMIIQASASPPNIPQRSDSSLGAGRRTVSAQSLNASLDNMSITSGGTLGSKGSKRRKGIRSFFGGKGPALPNSESDMSLNYARSTGSGSGDSTSKSRTRSTSERESPSIMTILGGKSRATTSQQIESDLGDMTYVSYDTGTSRSRSRSASVDPIGESPEPGASPAQGGSSRPRKSSLKRQSRYETSGRKASLTPANAVIPEEDEKAIYGVRFANATRGLGLRATAEEEAERAGGEHHALRWIGVGRGRYGELELTGEEEDELYARQTEEIKAKWRAFGRRASTDWSRVRVD